MTIRTSLTDKTIRNILYAEEIYFCVHIKVFNLRGQQSPTIFTMIFEDKKFIRINGLNEHNSRTYESFFNSRNAKLIQLYAHVMMQLFENSD